MLPSWKSQEAEMEENIGTQGSQSLLAEISSKLSLDVAPLPNSQASTTNRYFLSSGTDRSCHRVSSRNSSRSQPNQAEAYSSGSQSLIRRSQYYQSSPHHVYSASTCSTSEYTTPSSTEPSVSNLSSSSLMWDIEEEYMGQNYQLPPIHDHMKTLLSQLGSSISAMKAAYAVHLQAAMTAASLRGSSAHQRADQMSTAEKAMAEELQRLSDLHLQLVMLQKMQQELYNEEKETAQRRFLSVRRNDTGAAADSDDENEIAKEGVRSGGGVEKDAILKSYEGIIARFHDEIRRKDAVAEALKGTLAKSVLRGEKLERRVKSLETKLLDSLLNTNCAQ